MHNFTPIQSLIGGLVIGVASALLLVLNGRIAGISGIYGGVLRLSSRDIPWRLAFVLGLVAAGVAGHLWWPRMISFSLVLSPWLVAVAGLLVGFGTQMGGGCTSGHGVCGIGRLSKRSFAAVGTFMLTGVVTATIMRLLAGGAP